MPSAHWDALALWMLHKKGPRCQSSLCPHWLDISYPRFPPLRAATSTSSDGQESFHLSRLPTTPADSVCLGFKLSNNKGRVLKLHSLWFLIKQSESRVKGMPKTRVQMNPQTSPNAFPVSHEHVLQRQSQHLQQGVGIVQGTWAQIFRLFLLCLWDKGHKDRGYEDKGCVACHWERLLAAPGFPP